ncbi:MAG TPA: chromosome segregation protein SMC [Candidatus Dormibacteraeota bacterium]|nr:chromosome segregation protein SMC [Candidatus Dormibacteraeota bacterium]
MYLKSLRLQGFKTFARRTELPFSQGITAIVGPNGSGKSNLVDAIRWALGERNARGLRGQRMEDVIYAGGPGKSAVGMAEVTLVVDNADQRLNVEFSELEVARRLFRSGESEYLVNGSRARLKDIDALLASTGLRQDGYAVVAQNDIDFVIQAAPQLRRELIEEAAGVRRLRDQRQEALNRLAEADRDMRRARDILNELSPRAEELRVQAAAAEEYQKVAQALKALQGSLARDAWRKAMVQLRRSESRVQSSEQKCAAAIQAVADFEPRYAEHRSALLSAREARWRHQEAVADLRLRLAESQHQARIAQERNAAAVQALEALQGELRRLSASERAGGRVVKELSDALEAARMEHEAAAAELQAAVEAERTARESQAGLEDEHVAGQQRRQALQRERVAVEAELRQLEGRLQFLNEQQHQLRVQLEAWSLNHGTLTEELERRRATAETTRHEVEEITAATTAIDDRLAEAEGALELGRKTVVEHEGRLRSLEAELGALRTLLDHAQRHGPIRSSDEWDRLVALIEVHPKDRVAVEAALEGWLQGWVARDDQTFDDAKARLVDGTDVRETLLRPGRRPPADRIADDLAFVIDLVGAPEHVQPLLAHLLGDVVLVDDHAEAREVIDGHPELRAVTRSGELISAVSYRGGKAADALLDVQARIRDAENGLDAERQAALVAAEEVEQRAVHRAALFEERRKIRGRYDELRTAAAEAAGASAAAAEALARETQQEAQLRQQVRRIAGLLEQAEQLHVAAGNRQQATAESEASAIQKLAEIEQRIGEAGATLASLIERRQETELRAALRKQRRDDLGRQLERAQQVLESHGNELAQRRAAEEDLAVQPALIAEERRQWLERVNVLEHELAAVESAELPDSEALTGLETQLHEDEQRNVSLQVALAHADDARVSAISERDAARAEVDRCAAALHDSEQLVDEAEESTGDVDWQKTERDVSRLQRRLEAMGAVNLLAPDEYAQVSERCDSLASQLADLEQASSQLTDLRVRLEAEIDGRFRTVFQAVAVNFQEFFGELFPGGRATLRLEGQPAGNPLDDGVEILAQTPGKRLQTLTLLSGGERALTALAFLFGLQAVNPSPFYVLDEVDAALDDANVVRFNRVLKRLAAGQQFLIVTHNHSTMAQAEALYGVTLAEHGISRIVSVRLQHDTLVPVGERTA